MPTVAPYLDGLMVRNGSVYQGLWILPVCLISPEFEKSGEEFVTLSEGFKTGGIQVFETGAMEKVRIVNRGMSRAVALEGETLVGGAQNRIVNAGAVIAPGGEAELPSSCVEVRRWDCAPGLEDPVPADKKNFSRADVGFGSLRRVKLEEAVHSLRSQREVSIEQKTVWEHIVRLFGYSGASTKTLDLHDLYDFWDAPLRVFTQRFTVARNQVGAIVFQDKNNWFFDLFANRDLLFKHFKNIVRSHAFDTLIRLEREIAVPPSRTPSIEDARNVFKKIKLAQAHPFKVGSTTSLFFSTAKYNGIATLDNDTLIHLSACSK